MSASYAVVFFDRSKPPSLQHRCLCAPWSPIPFIRTPWTRPIIRQPLVTQMSRIRSKFKVRITSSILQRAAQGGDQRTTATTVRIHRSTTTSTMSWEEEEEEEQDPGEKTYRRQLTIGRWEKECQEVTTRQESIEPPLKHRNKPWKWYYF